MIPEGFDEKAYLEGQKACRKAKGNTKSKFAVNSYKILTKWCSWNRGWNDQLDEWDEEEKSK